MKLRTMLYGLTLMLGCFVLAACVNDEEGPCLPDGQTNVLFSLVLQDNMKATTRAGNETWSNYNPKDTGVEYDNSINLDKVQMLLFDVSGNYVGSLGNMTYTQSGENTYKYIGTAPTNLAAGSYKFVVLANCADAGLTVGTSKIADLNSKTFNLFAESGNTEYIPMWGVLQASLTLLAGNRQELGTISLLRAMSKVTVKLEAKENATGNPLRGYSLDTVTVSAYNKSGYITPTGAETAVDTKNLNLDASLRAYASAGTNKHFIPENEGATDLTFYLAEFDNSSTPAQLTVKLTKKVGDTTVKFKAPIQFCDYVDGKPKASSTYNIIRNHYYQFTIYSVSDDGELYVKPTVADWDNAAKLTYTMDMSTNMRLFDSWLYRYDTDGDYSDWIGSHMVVSSGRVETPVAPETVAGRPLRSPMIQLVTTTTAENSSFDLYVDNDKFEILRANKDDEAGVITSYTASTDSKLHIERGEKVYTYFYIVPKVGATFGAEDSVVAKVFLYYNDPQLGKQEVTYNNNSLPGYSDDSSEIWAYYVPANQYDAGNIGDNAFRKMYYQDANHPLEFVE